MRKKVFYALAFGAAVLLVLMAGGAIWLADSSLKPPVQPAHLVLSDERIPR